MLQRGRKSAESLTLAPVVTLEKFVKPPAEMPLDQVKTWTSVVKAPVFQLIGQEAYPVLVEYCRAVSAADLISKELESFDPGWLASDDGFKRWERLIKNQAMMATLIGNLSVKLRIAPSSRNDRDKAATLGKRGATRKPWEVDNEE